MTGLRILGPVRSCLPRLAAAALVAAAAELAGIALIATATWLLATAAQQPPLTALTVAIVSVRAFAIGRGVLRYVDRLVGHDAVLRALARLRATVFRSLTPLAPMGAKLFRGGDLLTRLVSDVDAVQDLLLRVLVPVWAAGAVAVAAIGFTAVFSPAAALVLAAAVLVCGVLLPSLAAVLARRCARGTVTRRAALATSTVDLIHGAADLAAYGATDAAVRRGADDARALAAAERTGTGVVTAVTAAHALVAGACVIGVLVTSEGLGVMTAVLALTALVSLEVMAPLPQAARRFVEVRSAIARLLVLLDAAPPVADPADPAELPATPPNPDDPIRSWGSTAHLVLDGAVPRIPARADIDDTPTDSPAADPDPAGISLDLPPGGRVAIVGASGAGKTMLLSMLVRFTPIAAGRVRLGGVDLDRLRGADVRRVIGGMLTDAHVFHSTVRDNLLLADPDADDEWLRAALCRAGLPDLDLSTAVGQDGRSLSGGQRQRLLLARALLGGHPILLLDEPTEHLDPATAAAVMDDLLSATDGRSLILVTHQLSQLDRVDEILVVEDGAVVQRGTHAELLDCDGPYRRFAGTFATGAATTRG